MTIKQSGNWRCFFWHVWRHDWRDVRRDLCIRVGCGVIRPHKRGTPYVK